MTTRQPEALRLADELCEAIAEYPEPTALEAQAAAELRRLYAYCQELESQVILDCMTHVQNPAEIEHVAGDVSKNGAGLNMSTQHTRITELESQLAQRFDAADMSTAAAQGFRDGVASVNAGWISVDERLPFVRADVLTARGTGPSCERTIAFYDPYRYTPAWRYTGEPSEGMRDVTHWMPLPPAPSPADGESNG